jgi:outer membrane protein assembly factor BamD (BamD/ComL family)
LYDQALRDSRATDADQVAALYRGGIIYEVKVGNVGSAAAWYEELIRRYPMNPMTDQAKNRLAALKTHS